MKKNILIFITVLVTTLLLVSGVEAAINISSNFNLSAQLPLDNRMATTTTTARDNIPTVQRYDGLFVYVTATDKTYQLQNGITNSDWVEWTFGGGGGVGTSTNPFMATYFVATSTTATSTGGNGWNLTGGCFAINGTCLSTHAPVTLSGALDYITLSGQDIIRGAIDLATDITGTLGITNGGTGTSTPATLGDVLAWNGTVWQGRATSTLGISGGGSGTVGSGTTGQFPYYAANGTDLTATSTLFVDTAGKVGVNTASPLANLHVLSSSGTASVRIQAPVFQTASILFAPDNAATADQWTISTNDARTMRFNNNVNPMLTLVGTQSGGSGYVGISSTTPGSWLSIGTTTSDFINLSISATSSLSRGVNINTGCFSINNVCVGTSHDAVTLAGTPDYITIAGQVITRALINLTTHVTGILPIANGGTGASAFGANRLPYMNSGNTALTSTSTIVVTSDKNLGLGSTTPINAIAIKRTNEDSAISFQVESTAGGAGAAAETATTSPGTAADSGTPGTSAWTTISNILTSNDVYATNATDLFDLDLSNFALATNYGFAIPTGSTINGIVVGVEAKEALSDNFVDNSIKLIVGGTQVGTNKSAGAGYTTADTFHTFGSPTDLWGLTPTVSEVNASNFGVAVQFQCTQFNDCFAGNISLDTVQVKIYYTTTGGSLSDQTWTAGQDFTDNKFKISFGNVLGSLTDYLTIASSTGQVSMPFWNSTSTTASSTGANGINLTGGCFAIAGTCIGGSGHSAVTLSGALDYITLVGQDIVRGAIDLTTDITGTLPVANGGTGITSFGAGIATWLGTPSIANFFSALTGEGAGVETFLTTPSSTNFFSMVTGETGSGAVVGGTSPTISGLTGTGTYDLSGATVKQHVYRKLTLPSATATTTTATTTIQIGQVMVAELFNFGTCRTTSGSSGYRFSDGTNFTNYIPASTTPSRFTFTSNNTWVADEIMEIEIGPLTNSVLTCGVDVTVN